MQQRFFTPGTARAILESVRGPAETMSQSIRSMELLRPERIAPDQPVDPDYFRLAVSVWAALDAIQRAGVVVRDRRAGVLDFPARRAGRVVVLRWRVGEPALCFWHEDGTSPSGRRPVDDDGPWESPEG